MFGYVTIAAAGLSRDRQDRYRAMYCGLCHTLGSRFGSVGRMTLSYDATFLYILLSSLSEPPETQQSGRCLPHPLHTHPYVSNEIAGYCCDMNLALSYHKCMDNWQDDRSPLSRAEAALLEKGYRLTGSDNLETYACTSLPGWNEAEKARLTQRPTHPPGCLASSTATGRICGRMSWSGWDNALDALFT